MLNETKPDMKLERCNPLILVAVCLLLGAGYFQPPGAQPPEPKVAGKPGKIDSG